MPPTPDTFQNIFIKSCFLVDFKTYDKNFTAEFLHYWKQIFSQHFLRFLLRETFLKMRFKFFCWNFLSEFFSINFSKFFSKSFDFFSNRENYYTINKSGNTTKPRGKKFGKRHPEIIELLPSTVVEFMYFNIRSY